MRAIVISEASPPGSAANFPESIALTEYRAVLAGIMDAAPDAIVVTDASGRIVLANRRVEELFGYAPADLIGQRIECLVPERSRERHTELRDHYGDAMSVREMGRGLELSAQRRDGAEVPIEISLSPMPTPYGNLVISVIRDVTARRAAQTQLREMNVLLEQRVRERTAELHTANRELEIVASSMAHDLRAPLRAISSFAARLCRHVDMRTDAEGGQLLTDIGDRTQQMSGMISDYLRFMNVSRRSMRPEPLDMLALLGEAWEAQVSAGLSAELHLGPLPPAFGDRELLGQIWKELLSNALKFSAHTPGALVTVGGEVRDGQVTYTVQDNGIGFDGGYAHKLFRIFERLHSQVSYPGNGIGLAIVKRIVDRYGGWVSLQALPECGARATFSLPVV
jgi:PAS domain S-box-containing protein